MREPGLWLVTAGVGFAAFLVGSGLEQNAIATSDDFGGLAPWIAHGIAVAVWCLAAYQWRRQPRRPAAGNAGPGLPMWQGYGIAALSLAWLVLALLTWFVGDLRSPSLMVGMAVAVVGHLIAGKATIRANRTAGADRRPPEGPPTGP